MEVENQGKQEVVNSAIKILKTVWQRLNYEISEAAAMNVELTYLLSLV